MNPACVLAGFAVLTLASCGAEQADDAPPTQPGPPLSAADRAAYDVPDEADDGGADQAAPAFPGFGSADTGSETLPLAGKPSIRCDGVRPADSPASVAGLAVGMTADEAIRVLACDDDITRVVASGDYSYADLDERGFDVRTEIAAADGQACTEDELPDAMDASRNRSAGRPPLPCEPDAVFGDRAKGVTEQIRLRPMGPPGEEVVYGIVRQTAYEGDARPSLAAVRDRLVARYGQPTREQRYGRVLEMDWSRTPDGTLLSPEERDPSCSVTPRIGGFEEFGDDCGVQVGAALVEAPDAPLLEELRVAVLDEAGLYAAMTATNEALARQRAASDARAVRDAADADDLDL